MSESLALKPAPLPGARTTKPAAKFRFGAMFMAALESLVAAQTRKIDETGPLLYRYPPI
jgi:hypothetical protein